MRVCEIQNTPFSREGSLFVYLQHGHGHLSHSTLIIHPLLPTSPLTCPLRINPHSSLATCRTSQHTWTFKSNKMALESLVSAHILQQTKIPTLLKHNYSTLSTLVSRTWNGNPYTVFLQTSDSPYYFLGQRTLHVKALELMGEDSCKTLLTLKSAG